MSKTWISLCLIALAALLGGCVTTVEGTSAQTGTSEQRLEAQLDLARGYLEQRDLRRARAPLQRALEIDPRSTEAMALMAVLSELEGEPELAEQYYRRALRIDPDDPQALNNFGRFLYGQERYEEAAEPLREVVRNTEYPRRAQAYENLGLAELKIGNRADAELAFQRALMLNMRQPRSTLELASLYYDAGNYPLAEQYFDEFDALSRHSPRSLLLCIRLKGAVGDEDAVASCSLSLKNLYPGSPEFRQFEESAQ